MSDPETKPPAAWFVRLWRGDVPLAQTFWLYYFAAVFALRVLSRTGGQGGVVLTLVAIGWAGFMVVPIIRAADQYPGSRLWAWLAKIMAACIAFAVLTDILRS